MGAGQTGLDKTADAVDVEAVSRCGIIRLHKVAVLS